MESIKINESLEVFTSEELKEMKKRQGFKRTITERKGQYFEAYSVSSLMFHQILGFALVNEGDNKSEVFKFKLACLVESYAEQDSCAKGMKEGLEAFLDKLIENKKSILTSPNM